ncbi:retrotransposon protein [Striga asiatica]|uniref:Retrotransposon protein n=1 Tax=Striga asiatica TaxID=4170 RepID=A0A5A7PN30_STRAF|nr:retrotransposon protein [Striga asiatica]
MGYTKETKGGLFYSPEDQKVIVSMNVRFLEEDYVLEQKPSSRHVLEEVKGVSTSIPSALDVTPQNTATCIANDAPEQVASHPLGKPLDLTVQLYGTITLYYSYGTLNLLGQDHLLRDEVDKGSPGLHVENRVSHVLWLIGLVQELDEVLGREEAI